MVNPPGARPNRDDRPGSSDCRQTRFRVVVRVGRARRSATAVPEEWPSPEQSGTEPGLQTVRPAYTFFVIDRTVRRPSDGERQTSMTSFIGAVKHRRDRSQEEVSSAKGRSTTSTVSGLARPTLPRAA